MRGGCGLLLWTSSLIVCIVVAEEKPKKSARAYSSSSSNYASSSSNNYGSGYDDNFDVMYSGMDLNNNGYSQKVKVSLPNPPKPPRVPRPMKAPNMGSYENDPNRVPHMPRPLAPPVGFGPMDIEFQFPSYEPNVDDTFFDSDLSGDNSYDSSSSSSSNQYSNKNNGGWANSVQNSYGSTAQNSYTSSTNGYNYGSSGTTSSPTNGTLCIPLSNPNAQGQCFDTSQLKTSCVGIQMSKSSNCTYKQFCCFSNPSTVKVAVDSSVKLTERNVCRPSSKSSGLGDCVKASELANICSGRAASKSEDCNANDWCCIRSDDSQSVTVDNVQQVNTIKVAKESSIAVKDRNVCHPSSEPTSLGVCVFTSELATVCIGQAASKSNDCTANDWCCIRKDNKTQAKVVKDKVRDVCRPSSKPSSFGDCIVTSELSGFCNGRAASKSEDCNANDWCCIRPEDDHSEIKVVNDAIQVAVDNSQVPSSVKDKVRDVCRPSSKPSSFGDCILSNELASFCNGRAASKSKDCNVDDWCCIRSEDNQTVVGNNQAAAASHVLSTTQAAVETSSAAAIQSESKTTTASHVAVDNANTLHSVQIAEVSTIKPSDVEASTSVAQDSGLKVAIAGTASSSSNPDLCTPNDNLNIHNGVCLTMRQLTQQCQDKKASASQSCSFGRFCCYSEDNIVAPAVNQNVFNKDVPTTIINLLNNKKDEAIVAPVVSSSVKACTPNSNLKITNGQCMTIRELRVKCVDSKASPSSHCDMGSWCCFNDEIKEAPPVELPQAQVQPQLTAEVVTDAPTTPTTTQAITTQALVTEAPTLATVPVTVASTLVPALVTDTSTLAPVVVHSSDEQTCSPNSKPEIIDGACMPTRDLRIRCKNQRVSKSPTCKLGQWCCFADPSNPVQLNVNELSRTIEIL